MKLLPHLRVIPRIACFISIALCALLVLQSAGIVPPAGWGWGDGARGRAYDVYGAEGSIVFRTASGMKAPTGAGGLTYGVQTLGRFDGVGIHYFRWNTVLKTPDRKPLPGNLGTFVEVRIALGWPVLLSLLLLSLCLVLFVKQRRRARIGQHCRNCGYELRATPDRCPECGLVPPAHAAPAARGSA